VLPLFKRTILPEGMEGIVSDRTEGLPMIFLRSINVPAKGVLVV
jgi:hypothetical protein